MAIISAKTKTDMVVENVIHTISVQNYKPGDKIPPESYFVKEYDVSRVTVREAFKRLSSLGVVTIKSGDGTFVNAIKPFEIKEPLLPLLTIKKDTIKELYETRICIELFILELAIERRSEENLIDLLQIIQNMENNLDSNDIDRYSAYDDDFHNYLSIICGNSILESIYESLRLVRKANISKSNQSDESLAMSMQEHREIYNAIKLRDTQAAVYTMKRHLLRSKKNVLEET